MFYVFSVNFFGSIMFNRIRTQYSNGTYMWESQWYLYLFTVFVKIVSPSDMSDSFPFGLTIFFYSVWQGKGNKLLFSMTQMLRAFWLVKKKSINCDIHLFHYLLTSADIKSRGLFAYLRGSSADHRGSSADHGGSSGRLRPCMGLDWDHRSAGPASCGTHRTPKWFWWREWDGSGIGNSHM